MLKRVLFLLLALGPMVAPVEASWWDSVAGVFSKNKAEKPPTLKVLVVHDKEGVVVEVKGKYKINDPNTGEHISTRFIGKRKLIQTVHDGLKWGEEFPGIYQLEIVPDEAGTTTVVDGIEYHGPIFVYDIGGTVSIVNQVYVEDFLSSALANRYRQQFSQETLAAIAIAARTASYYRVQNPKSKFWGVDGEQAGYQGFAAINASSRMEQAIANTKYMVMSRSTTDQGTPETFLAKWPEEKGSNSDQAVVAKITLTEAEEMAKKGDNAAQILAKAFPGVKIQLVHYEEN